MHFLICSKRENKMGRFCLLIRPPPLCLLLLCQSIFSFAFLCASFHPPCQALFLFPTNLVVALYVQSMIILISPLKLPVSIQALFRVKQIYWFFFLSMGYGVVFFSTKVRRRRFFFDLLVLLSSFHNHTLLPEKPSF